MAREHDVKELIENKSRRLHKLKLQEAREGQSVNPGIITEIEDIETELQELQAELKEIKQSEREPSPSVPAPITQRVPFTDQEDKIELILSSHAPSYYLLDAPAGYGKTALLMELKRRFQEKGWGCAYVSADEHETLEKLIGALFKELDLDESPRIVSAKRLGLDLGGLLKRKWQEEIMKEGLVFLIDLGKTPPSTLVSDLLKQFIPNVQSTLRTDSFFQSKHNRFRVVLAGRYLAGREEITSKSLRLNVLQLPPFSYEILKHTAREYLANCAEDTVTQISAHIMHITGGHPGCMAALLEMYRREGWPPPDDFLELYRSEIQQIIDQEIDRVQMSIPGELQEVMDSLGIFRYLNYTILDRLIHHQCIPVYDEAFALADKLTGAYLLGWEGRLLRNDSTHRLLALRLRRQVDCAKLAQELCEEYLGEPTAHMPEMWVIEAMYQYLQRFAQAIDDPKKRQQLRRTFMEQVVPGVLKKFVERRQPREEYEALKRALKIDQEFRFTVNYYLREAQYDDETYNDLQRQIDSFFARA
jgi:hypothetical protein